MHLDPYIIGHLILLDEFPYEAKVCVASSRICNFDLFEAALDEMAKEGGLLFDGHRDCQCLVSIAQIGREPYGRFSDEVGWPFTVMQDHRSIRLILARGVGAEWKR
jgi:hypothetical protein